MMDEKELSLEELLNSYVDDELAERHCNEVKRLVAHDEKIAEQLRKLQKQKELLGALPRASAPADLVENVKQALESKILLDEYPHQSDEDAGVRHLKMRHMLARAAMIGLVAVLGYVVFSVVMPIGGSKKPLVSTEQIKPDVQVAVKDIMPASVVSDSEAAAGLAALMPFGLDLRVETAGALAVNKVIGRAIYDHNLLDFANIKREAGKSIYSLTCSRQQLAVLISELDNVWNRFEKTSLIFSDESFVSPTAIDDISSEQMLAILSEVDVDKRIGMAMDFAVLNSVGKLLPGRELFAHTQPDSQNVLIPPKPVLTSGKLEPSIENKSQGQEQINMTITVTGI